MTTAFKYLQLMVDDGLKPDIGIYNALSESEAQLALLGCWEVVV